LSLTVHFGVSDGTTSEVPRLAGSTSEIELHGQPVCIFFPHTHLFRNFEMGVQSVFYPINDRFSWVTTGVTTSCGASG
jgi:hypothetical protein